MSEQIEKNELTMWLSTYGLLTAEQLLESCGIILQHDDLIRALNNPSCFYHKILLVPLKNIFNGIIFQQVHDYQVYVQKVFIDYYLSGETTKEEDSPGAATRGDLEDEHKKLIDMNTAYHQEEANQVALLAECQTYLINYIKGWSQDFLSFLKGIKDRFKSEGIEVDDQVLLHATNLLIICEKNGSLTGADWALIEKRFGQKLPETLRAQLLKVLSNVDSSYEALQQGLELYIERAREISVNVRQFRADFQVLIIRVNELIRLLPDYVFDVALDDKNRSTLYFDARIGEED